jgi:hypothetical protein
MAMPKRKHAPMEGLPRLSGRDVVAAANEDAPLRSSSRDKRGRGAHGEELTKVMYRFEPCQIAALRAEAHRRAEMKRKTERVKVVREDASEVLREIVDVWFAKR